MNEVDPQIIDAINQSARATMESGVVQASGAGKAYQMVAQSCAIAIQDAADNLRNVNTIATTAMGVAMAQLLDTGDPQYTAVLDQAQALMTASAQNYAAVGAAAADLLKNFPSS